MRSTLPRQNEINVRIGAQLRVIYDDVLREPIPESFSKLLERLEAGAAAPLRLAQKHRECPASRRSAGQSDSARPYSVRRRARA
jgi:hypothetical protein